MSDDQHHGEFKRRLNDVAAPWLMTGFLAVIAALLGVVVFNYKDVPQQINSLQDTTNLTQLEIRYMKSSLQELTDANRVSQSWRERLLVLEQQNERLKDRLTAVEVQLKERPRGR